MKLAALQMISGPTVTQNLDTATRLIKQAAAAGAQLAVCPPRGGRVAISVAGLDCEG